MSGDTIYPPEQFHECPWLTLDVDKHGKDQWSLAKYVDGYRICVFKPGTIDYFAWQCPPALNFLFEMMHKRGAAELRSEFRKLLGSLDD